MEDSQIIATELKVNKHQIWAAVKLLDSGATVPFIARYRKEVTGGLSDTHLRMLAERLDYLRELERQRVTILQGIESQGKLTDSLKTSIQNASTKAELEDLYLPFRPKRQTKAQAARDAGLGPLADKIFADPSIPLDVLGLEFVNADKNVPDLGSALAGAREILIEKFSENAGLIGSLREEFWKSGWIVSSASPTAKDKEDASKFADYFNYREPVREIPSHRVLALLRGRQEGVLRVSLETEAFADSDPLKRDEGRDYIAAICRQFGLAARGRAADAWLLETARYAWKYKIRIHLELDLMTRLRKSAEEESIRVFAENLKNLLLAAPAGPRATIGLDPGFRTGVKIAIIDKTGKLISHGTIFPHAPQERRDEAIEVIGGAIKKHGIELVAIGNGTASRETDQLVSLVAKKFPELKFQKIVVSEAGASVYSASAVGAEEFPHLDVSIRGAVSIARRLQDPLAELVKIDPKSIGVGQYQHDVSQTRLEQMLHNVVEDCVNAVGVDVNMASPALLSYISGLTKRTAADIVAWRDQKGAFKNRVELSKVPGIGAKVFQLAAGFLRISGGDNPLDRSGVHPEAYPVVERMLEQNKASLETVLGNSSFLKNIKPEAYVSDAFGVLTIQDILAELEKPGRDPRPEFKAASFKEGITTLEDLKIGMVLEGTVTNVANFGAFVDIGVHQDGLIHVSQLSDRFVENPHEVVKTGQVVKVRVLEIDKVRNRVALSMKSKFPLQRQP